MNDAGNLQNLNDIVTPAAVAWWPPAPGWYLLLGAVVVAVAVLAFLRWRRWRQDRYRRLALRELSSIRATAPGTSPQQVPELLKRAALSVWPREEVAALSGPPWHRFLDQSGGFELFCSGAGATMDQLAYAVDAQGAGDPETNRLLDAAEAWLKRHTRREAGG